MARKAFAILFFLSLWLVSLNAWVSAAVYDLGEQGSDSQYTWRHGYSGGTPWAEDTEFIAGAPVYLLSPENPQYNWHLGYSKYGEEAKFYSNSKEGTHTGPDSENKGTYTIVFDTCSASPKFGLNITNVPNIASNDAVATYSVSYRYQGPGTYSILSAQLLITGTNYLDNNTPFKITAVLQENFGNHQNVGYISSMQLEYPAVPLPGGLWLLGTGLLGLFCLGFRRR